MEKFKRELESLRGDGDKVEWQEETNGYTFFGTTGHGYLVVPRNDKHFRKALSLAEYGYLGKLALYLEEDCEAPQFIDYIKNLEVSHENL